MVTEPDRLERLMRYIAWIARLGLAPEQARQATEERDRLLAALGGAHYAAGGCKPHTGDLSPGCQRCIEGVWSCLFINGLCTANCFYCPQDRTMRQERGPIAEEIPFDDPATYVAYLRRFDFRGASFSGGEPLIVFDKVIAYLEEIKAAFGREMYVWLYTNGDLVDAAKLRALRNAGLDELRFDISARDYRLRPVDLARDHLPTVTVEVPAIPEDVATLERCLTELAAIGVDHVNLHQLMASEHNYTAMRARGYTFLPPLAFREPPVLESELVALRVMIYAAELGLDLPIHYCSHAYKARYQNLARRRRAALSVREPFERITAAGYLARWSLAAPAEEIAAVAGALRGAGLPAAAWALNDAGTELSLREDLLDHPALDGHAPALGYFEADIVPAARPGAVREIALGGGKTLHLTRQQVARHDGPAATAPAAWERMETGLPPLG
jgi:pyruvate formate-lyase activating enzyme-like uncharacterized protein